MPRAPRPWTDWRIWQFGVDGGVDRNRFRGSVEDLRALLLPEPLSYDTLGPVVSEVRAAEGRGRTVEDFQSRDEGPVIDGR